MIISLKKEITQTGYANNLENEKPPAKSGGLNKYKAFEILNLLFHRTTDAFAFQGMDLVSFRLGYADKNGFQKDKEKEVDRYWILVFRILDFQVFLRIGLD